MMYRNNKVGIIIPYRQREEHLKEFLSVIRNYLDKTSIKYEIIVICQDNAKQFNRGMLLNIGYTYAKKMKCNYLIFHDVDMLPVDIDYSYSKKPIHFATNFIQNKGDRIPEIFEQYFGGVTLFPIQQFEKVNGYSNKYWGWGYEDTDLLHRCEHYKLQLNTLKIKNRGKNIGKFLKFNGINSLIECKNIIDYNSNISISVTFYPEKLLLNHTKTSDEFTIFSVPGWDFAISYTSFSRYNFCIFDINHKPLFINSPIKTNYKTNIIVTINVFEKWIKVYQDGICIGTIDSFKRLYFYRKEPFFYLGAGSPNREITPNYFIGHFESFAYFDEILKENEIKEIAENDVYLLRKDFGDYKSSDKLKCYYDAGYMTKHYELTDLSGNNNHGKIYNCELVERQFDQFKEIKIPYRKKGIFRLLNHEENGFLGTDWKDSATRWNQLRFHNEVINDNSLIQEDGLSDLKFVEHSKEYKDKFLLVNVGI